MSACTKWHDSVAALTVRTSWKVSGALLRSSCRASSPSLALVTVGQRGRGTDKICKATFGSARPPTAGHRAPRTCCRALSNQTERPQRSFNVLPCLSGAHLGSRTCGAGCPPPCASGARRQRVKRERCWLPLSGWALARACLSRALGSLLQPALPRAERCLGGVPPPHTSRQSPGGRWVVGWLGEVCCCRALPPRVCSPRPAAV